VTIYDERCIPEEWLLAIPEGRRPRVSHLTVILAYYIGLILTLIIIYGSSGSDSSSGGISTTVKPHLLVVVSSMPPQ